MSQSRVDFNLLRPVDQVQASILDNEARALSNAQRRQSLSLADLQELRQQQQFQQKQQANQLALRDAQLQLGSRLAGAALQVPQEQRGALLGQLQGLGLGGATSSLGGLQGLAESGITAAQRVTQGQNERRINLEQDRLDENVRQFDQTFDQSERRFAVEDEKQEREFQFLVDREDERTRQFYNRFSLDQLNSERDFDLRRTRLLLSQGSQKGFSSEVGKLVGDLQLAQQSGNGQAVELIQKELGRAQQAQTFEIIKKVDQKRYEDLVKQSEIAQGQLKNFDQIEGLLERTDTGLQNVVTFPVNRALNAIGNIFGIQLGADISDKEALNALLNQGVLEQAKNLTGPKSDKDVAFLKASVPGLLNSKEGNLILVNLARQIALSKIDLEQYVSDQLTTEESRTVTEARKKWQNINDGQLLDASTREQIRRLSGNSNRRGALEQQGDAIARANQILGL